MKRIFWFLLGLLAFAIPIEHKYDKPLRHFSKSLLPDNLSLPSWFDKKIYFYPSDWIVLFLVLLACFVFHIPLGNLLRRAWPLWILFICMLLSIANSPLAHYSLLYFRLWQWATAFLLFATLSSLDTEERKTATKVVLSSLVAMGIFQSLLAITQYFHQGSLGLRLLGEPKFSTEIPGYCGFPISDGMRWIIDRWTNYVNHANALVRVMGTTPHPNVLGGFLMMTSLATIAFLSEAKKRGPLYAALFLQMFALVLTYSRSALFAFFLGCVLWCWREPKKQLVKATMVFIALAGTLLFFLFQEQLAARGGLIGSNYISEGSNTFRTTRQNLSFQMMEQHPFLGVGFQQFSTRAHEFIPGQNSIVHVNGAHNIYLIMGAEIGLFAMLCFLGFLAAVGKSGMQSDSPYAPSLLAIFVGFLFIGGCDFYPTLFQMGRLMLFLTAGLLSFPRMTQTCDLKQNNRITPQGG